MSQLLFLLLSRPYTVTWGCLNWVCWTTCSWFESWKVWSSKICPAWEVNDEMQQSSLNEGMMGTGQDPQWMPETTDNTKPCIYFFPPIHTYLFTPMKPSRPLFGLTEFQHHYLCALGPLLSKSSVSKQSVWSFSLLLAHRSKWDIWLPVAVVSEAPVSLWFQRKVPGTKAAWVEKLVPLVLSVVEPLGLSSVTPVLRHSSEDWLLTAYLQA